MLPSGLSVSVSCFSVRDFTFQSLRISFLTTPLFLFAPLILRSFQISLPKRGGDQYCLIMDGEGIEIKPLLKSEPSIGHSYSDMGMDYVHGREGSTDEPHSEGGSGGGAASAARRAVEEGGGGGEKDEGGAGGDDGPPPPPPPRPPIQLRVRYHEASKSHYNIQCSEIFTLRNEKLHTET